MACCKLIVGPLSGYHLGYVAYAVPAPANLTEAVRQLGLEARQRNAREHDGIRQATALILSRRAQGLSCERIAGELSAFGLTARRGGAFSQKQVQRLLDRATSSEVDAAR